MTLPGPVVVLANGVFPTHPIPLKVLRKARTLICTDGSRDKAIQAGLSPKQTVGDMDSLEKRPAKSRERITPIPGQDSTDLEKALEWCLESGLTHATIMGITGGRDDQTLANFYILATFSRRLKLKALTDHFTIHCVWNHRTFRTHPGQRISLLPVLDRPVVSTEGLQFPLNREALRPGGMGISNRTTGNSFSVTVDDGSVLVFVQHPE